MAGQRKIPFRMGTRQRRVKIGTIPYAAGQTSFIEIPRVGLLSRVYVQLRGTITRSGAGTLTDLGPWNTISRLRVTANTGSAQVVDVSGYGAYASQAHLTYGYRPDLAGMGNTTPNSDIYVYPLTTGTQTIALPYWLPISINTGANFETGLINLQSPETRLIVELAFGSLTDPDVLITAASLTAHVYYEYYEIPQPQNIEFPPLTVARLLEDQQSITATGENIYQLPRMGTVLWLQHVMSLNGARSDSYDSVVIRINKTDEVYRQERQLMQADFRPQFGLNPVTGIIEQDWYHAYGQVNMGDTRDAFDSEEVTTLESIVNVTAGATLGSGNNILRSVRRLVQIFQ